MARDAVTGILFATDGNGSFDQLRGIEALTGGAAGDLLSGDSAPNFLRGGGGKGHAQWRLRE